MELIDEVIGAALSASVSGTRSFSSVLALGAVDVTRLTSCGTAGTLAAAFFSAVLLAPC